MAERIVVGVLHLQANGIAGREVKDNDVAFLRCSPSAQTFVVPMRFIPIALSAAEDSRPRVLHKRHGQWRIRHTRAVTHLAHVKEVAHAQTLLQGRRRNLVVLEQIEVNEVHRYECEDDSIYPRADGIKYRLSLRVLRLIFAGRFVLAPPTPVDILRGKHIHYHRQD